MKSRFLASTIADTSLQLALARNLLREAIALLNDGDEQFVCCALRVAYENDRDVTRYMVYDKLKTEIMTRIFPHPTVTSWLVEEAGIDDKLVTGVAARQYRIRWCNDMIKELHG